MRKAYEAYEAHQAYEAYEVRFHAAVAESGTLRALILALGRFALGENGVTMGLPPHAPPEGVTPSDSLLRFAAALIRKQKNPLPAIAQR